MLGRQNRILHLTYTVVTYINVILPCSMIYDITFIDQLLCTRECALDHTRDTYVKQEQHKIIGTAPNSGLYVASTSNKRLI